MQKFFSPLLQVVAVSTLGWMASPVIGDVLINIDTGTLYYPSTSATAPDSTLLILAADTANDGFQGPTPSAFVTGDDVELGRWTLRTSLLDNPGFGSFGLQLTTAALSAFPGLTFGDPLRLYWYPTLTQASTSPTFPTAGTPYGTYRDDTDPDAAGPKIAYLFPGDNGNTYTLELLTLAEGGSLSEATGVANLTVVPEPSTYALVAGIGCLAFGAIARRSRSKRA